MCDCMNLKDRRPKFLCCLWFMMASSHNLLVLHLEVFVLLFWISVCLFIFFMPMKSKLIFWKAWCCSLVNRAYQKVGHQIWPLDVQVDLQIPKVDFHMPNLALKCSKLTSRHPRLTSRCPKLASSYHKLAYRCPELVSRCPKLSSRCPKLTSRCPKLAPS